MSKPALSVVYFVLTFVAGAAVGSWALWIYLMGFPAGQTVPETVEAPPAASAQPASPREVEPARDGDSDTVVLTPSSPTASGSEARDAADGATPTAKGHWNTEEVPGRSHEECLAMTKELNDAYKDCRFGVHKRVWVED